MLHKESYLHSEQEIDPDSRLSKCQYGRSSVSGLAERITGFIVDCEGRFLLAFLVSDYRAFCVNRTEELSQKWTVHVWLIVLLLRPDCFAETLGVLRSHLLRGICKSCLDLHDVINK